MFRLLERPLQNSQPLIEVPKLEACNKRALQGLDAFTKTYYHLPIAGVGVVDEKSLAAKEAKDAKTLASEVEKMMEDCRAQVSCLICYCCKILLEILVPKLFMPLHC